MTHDWTKILKQAEGTCDLYVFKSTWDFPKRNNTNQLCIQMPAYVLCLCSSAEDLNHNCVYYEGGLTWDCCRNTKPLLYGHKYTRHSLVIRELGLRWLKCTQNACQKGDFLLQMQYRVHAYWRNTQMLLQYTENTQELHACKHICTNTQTHTQSITVISFPDWLIFFFQISLTNVIALTQKAFWCNARSAPLPFLSFSFFSPDSLFLFSISNSICASLHCCFRSLWGVLIVRKQMGQGN